MTRCDGCGHVIPVSDVRAASAAIGGGGTTDWCGACNAAGLLAPDDSTRAPFDAPLVLVCLVPQLSPLVKEA